MHFTLLQLTDLLESTLAQVFYGKTFELLAETSEIKKSGNGHFYFDLIEKNGQSIVAKMNAVIWKSASGIIAHFEKTTGQKFERNLKLMLKAEVRFHAAYGLQLQVTDIDTSYTIGQLTLQRQATLQLLLNNNKHHIAFTDGNYITTNNKLQPQGLLKNIALITAINSDGWRDFMHELENNTYGYCFNVTPFYATVQGHDAAIQILKQLDKIKLLANNFDAVAMVRGGGAHTDFIAFDDYNLCASIAAFPLPVIAGLGHERNVSICDLMCFSSAKTPTKAAAFFIDQFILAETNLNQLYDRFLIQLDNCIQLQKNNINQLHDNLLNEIQQQLEQQHFNLQKAEIAVKHLNPDKILQRGFAIIYKGDNVISNANKLNNDDTVKIVFHKGNAIAVIKK